METDRFAKSVRCGVVVLAGGMVCSSALAQADYQIDDGTAEFQIGSGPEVTLIWGNMFAVDPSALVLNNIQFGFGVTDAPGGTLVGESVTWAVFGEDDGDPSGPTGAAGLTLLASGTHVIQNEDFQTTGELDTIPLNNLDVGFFDYIFVAVSHDDLVGDFRPAAMDSQPTGSAMQSWVTNLGFASSDAADDEAYAFAILTDALLPGNWIIRANADSDPSCRADIDGDGVLTLFDFLSFQNAFDAGSDLADFDGDGVLTLFDFLAFQNEFDAGC